VGEFKELPPFAKRRKLYAEAKDAKHPSKHEQARHPFSPVIFLAQALPVVSKVFCRDLDETFVSGRFVLIQDSTSKQ